MAPPSTPPAVRTHHANGTSGLREGLRICHCNRSKMSSGESSVCAAKKSASSVRSGSDVSIVKLDAAAINHPCIASTTLARGVRIVADFSVKNDDEAAIITCHRLGCAVGQINDGEAAVPEPAMPVATPP